MNKDEMNQMIEKDKQLSCEFLQNYLKECKKYLKYVEDAGIDAGKIDGHVAFQFRNWVEVLDGILILCSSSSINNSLRLLRSLFEIFIQFKFFFADTSQMDAKMKCYLVVFQYKKIALLKKYNELAKNLNDSSKDCLQEQLKITQEQYEKSEFWKDCKIYKQKIEEADGKKDWYTVYDPTITSIRKIVEHLNSSDQKQWMQTFNLIYGNLSWYSHGFQSGDAFTFENGKMVFAPLRSMCGANFLILVTINHMFDSMIKVIQSYYGNRVNYKSLMDINMLNNQPKLLQKIQQLETVIINVITINQNN